MERLQYIVVTRRRKMAGHVLRVKTEIPAHAIYWEKNDGDKTWRSTISMEPAGSQVTETYMEATRRPMVRHSV